MPENYSEQLEIIREALIPIKQNVDNALANVEALSQQSSSNITQATTIKEETQQLKEDTQQIKTDVEGLQSQIAATGQGHVDAAGVHATNAANSAANAAANSSGQNMAGLSGSITANAVADPIFYNTDGDDHSGWVKQVSNLEWFKQWGEWPGLTCLFPTAAGLDIYDATGPGLVFYATLPLANYPVAAAWSISSVSAKNGFIVFTLNGTYGGTMIINLIDDYCQFNRDIAESYTGRLSGVYRTEAFPDVASGGAFNLPSELCNDCDLDLDPKAPYDRMGNRMPIPLLGTDGGFVAIHPNGDVAVIAHADNSAVQRVSLWSQNMVAYDASGFVHVREIPKQTVSVGSRWFKDAGDFAFFPRVHNPAYSGAHAVLSPEGENVTTLGDGVIGTSTGLNAITTGWTPDQTLVTRIRHDFAYTTVGNVKAALLCSTTIGTVSGAQLVQNPSFDGDFTGWTDMSTGTGSTSVSGNALVTNGSDSSNRAIAYQAISTVIGRRYRVRMSTSSFTSGNAYPIVGTTPNGSQLITVGHFNSVETIEKTFVAETTTTYVTVNSQGVMSFDNIMVYLDDDNLVPLATGVTDQNGATSTLTGDTVRIVGDGVTPFPKTLFVMPCEIGQYYKLSISWTGAGSSAVFLNGGNDQNTLTSVNADSGTLTANVRTTGNTINLVPVVQDVNADVTFTLSVTPITNLIENGDFATNDLTGFTDESVGSGSVDASSGSAVITGSGGSDYGRLRVDLSNLVVGEVYEMSFTFSGAQQCYHFANNGKHAVNHDAGPVSYKFTASNAAQWFTWTIAGLNGTITVDNIQLRHIPNLVTNGTFDSGISDWVEFDPARGDVTHNATDKRIRLDNSTGTGNTTVTQAVSVNANKMYRVSCLGVGDGAFARLSAGVTDGSGTYGFDLGSGSTAEDVLSLYVRPAVTTIYIQLLASGSGAAEFGDIIVEEIPNLITTAPNLDDPFTWNAGTGTLTANGSVGTGGDWAWWDIPVTPNQPVRFRATVTSSGTGSLVRISNGASFSADLLNENENDPLDIDKIIVPTSSTIRLGVYALDATYDYEVSNIILEEVDQLLINGDFATGDLTGWVDNSFGAGAVTVSGGRAIIDAPDGSNFGRFYQIPRNLVVGQQYALEFRVDGPNDGSLQGPTGQATYATGETHRVTFKADATSEQFQFSVSGNNGTTEISQVRLVQIVDLVVNGGFDGDIVGYTISEGTAEYDEDAQGNGRLKLINLGTGSNVARASQAIPTIIGETYKVTVNTTAGTAPNAQIAASNNANMSGAFEYTFGAAGAPLELHFTAQASTTYVGMMNYDLTANIFGYFDNLSVTRVIADRTHNQNHLKIIGSISGVLRGGVVMYPMAANSGNYFQGDCAAVGLGDGDFYYEQLVKTPLSGAVYLYDTSEDAATAGGDRCFAIFTPSSSVVQDPSGVHPLTGVSYDTYMVLGHGREGGVGYVTVNGVRTNTGAFTHNPAGNGHEFYPGQRFTNIQTMAEIGPFSITDTTPSADQLKHSAETLLAQLDGPVTLGGTSSDVLACRYDALENKLYALTSDGRTIFDATTWTRLEFDPAYAGATSLDVMDGYSVTANYPALGQVDPVGPAYNLRHVAQRRDRHKRYQREWITGNGSLTQFEMKEGHRVKAVTGSGAVGPLRYGEDEAWTNPSNGYREILTFDTAPTGDVAVDVEIAL